MLYFDINEYKDRIKKTKKEWKEGVLMFYLFPNQQI